MGILTNYVPLITGVSASVISSTILILKETIYLEKYRKLFATHTVDDEVPVGEPVQKKFQEVMNDLKLPSIIREKLKVFNTPLFDLIHFGLFIDKYGGAIGVPPNFNYPDVATVMNSNIKAANTAVDWHTDYGKKLAESLVLSADAQKYALACQIKKLYFNESLFSAGVCSIITITMCGVYNLLRNKQKLTRKPFHHFVTVCAFVGFGIFNYKTLVALHKKGNDIEIDKELCKLGPKYIEGGKEYYEKLLTRNEILDYIFKDAGWGVAFTQTTNAKALKLRKSIFETELQNLSQMV